MTADTTTYPVVLATDENYAAPCGVVMESLLQNTDTPAKFEFFVFESDLGGRTKDRLRHVAESHGAGIEIRSFDTSRFSQLPQDFTADAYTRLYAPRELQQFSRLLYLDCDLLVQRDAEKLFKVDLEDHTIGAVPNGPAPFISDFNRKYGFSEGDNVFNSGVLLINPGRWTEENAGERVVNWVEENKTEIEFPDQEGINIILKDEIRPLNHQWNMEARHYREWWMGISEWWPKEAEGRNLIMHYTGARKPWRWGTFVPKQRAYYSYLKETPFIDTGAMPTSGALFNVSQVLGGLHFFGEVARVRLGDFRRRLASS